MRPPPRSTLFPYTTLFRSVRERDDTVHIRKIASQLLDLEPVFDVVRHGGRTIHAGNDRDVIPRSNASAGRSEEHTSELQSHSDLVCRLLLEKKKKHIQHAR